MKYSTLLILSIGFNFNTIAQGLPIDVQVQFANTITTEHLRTHLSILASDAFEGRETGEIGQKLAAEYIVSQFKEIGIPPIDLLKGYYQNIPLIKSGWGKMVFTDQKNEYQFLKDYYSYAGLNNQLLINTSEVIFLGYGIDDSVYSDYANVNVKGKTIIVMEGEPKEGEKWLITGNDLVSDWSKDWKLKVAAATKNGVGALLMIDAAMEDKMKYANFINYIQKISIQLQSNYSPSNFAPHLYISRSMADQILSSKKNSIAKSIQKITKTGKPSHYIVNNEIAIAFTKIETSIYSENILGYIEGSDLKTELVVVSAHYDHIGVIQGVVHNGADDDGSGTVGLIEMAEAMMEAKKSGNGPRRSVLFLAFTGEEKRLLGSEYYSDNPVFKLESTVANLNIDMIGRVDEKHLQDSNYIYIIGSNFLSNELHQINEFNAQKYTRLKLDYTYNKTSDPNRFYYRSDHYNFAKNNIPIIFFFNGTHPDYHAPGDDFEKINFDLLQERCKLVFYNLWTLANQTKRIEVDVK